MCSPEVGKVVSERIKREGRPQRSRRGFLKFGGAALAGLALGANVAPSTRARAQVMPLGEVVDLTHVLSTDFPLFPSPAYSAPQHEPLVTVENDGFYAQGWTFGEHTSTHMDFPAHFIGDGMTVDEYPAAALVGPAVVIDIAARAEDNPDTMVTPDDLAAWESDHGEIPPGAFVCMYSGWEEKVNDAAAFQGMDDEGNLHFPGFSPEASAFLVEERDINGIVVDTLSLDRGLSSTFDTHVTILGAGLLGVENVANLARIKGANATLVFGIPRYETGSGGPCRALAFVADAM